MVIRKFWDRACRLNGRDYTVIGILPAGVRLDRGPGTFFDDVFTPIGQTKILFSISVAPATTQWAWDV